MKVNTCVPPIPLPEEILRSSHLVANHDSPFSRLLNLEHLDHWTEPVFDVPHNLLIDVQSVFGSLLEETLIGNKANVGLAVLVEAFWVVRWWSWERAARDEVATELLGSRCRDLACTAVGFESVCLVDGRVVEIAGIDAKGTQ